MQNGREEILYVQTVFLAQNALISMQFLSRAGFSGGEILESECAVLFGAAS